MTNLPITGIFTITATYGQTGKYWANGHKGVDIVCSNKDIYSPCDGVVRIISFDKDGWGQYVSIGDFAGNRHILCHLVKGSVKVKSGQSVNRNTIIGTMGTTGNSTGVHLHYELHDSNGKVIDVTSYMGVPNQKGTYNSKDYQIKEKKKMKFKDADKISDWAKDSVENITDLELMNGVGNGYFNPKRYITAEQLAVVLDNALKKGYLKK